MRRGWAIVPWAVTGLLATGLATLLVLLGASSTARASEVRLAITPDGRYEVDWATHQPLGGATDRILLDGNVTRLGGHATAYLKGNGWPWLVGLTTHRVPLGALPPGRHAYRLPDGTAANFTVASPDHVDVDVLGDTGLNDEDRAFVARVAASRPDLVLHVGDLAYAYNDEWKWESWMATLQAASQLVPFMPVPGNHEVQYGEDYRNYDARFAPDHVHHGSFDFGPCHIVRLDSEDLDPGQDAWLRGDLEAVNRTRTPWVIALLHRPMYSSGILHTGDKALRTHFEGLFDAHHVDLVLTGHEHNYERTVPVQQERPVQAGPGPYTAAPVYVVTGGGGATLYPDFHPQPAWSAKREVRHEMLHIAATRGDLQVKALADDGAVLDAFTVTH